MSQPNVVTRVNNLVQSLERPYIDLTGSGKITGKLEFNIMKVLHGLLFVIPFYSISKWWYYRGRLHGPLTSRSCFHIVACVTHAYF